MKRLKIKRDVFLAPLVAISFFATMIMPVWTVAADPAPQFSLSATSGRPGQRIGVASVDACPALPVDFEYQFVEFTFIDADNVHTVSPYTVSVDETGQWSDDTGLAVPWRDIDSSNPTNAAATGPAIVQARCMIGRSVSDDSGPLDPVVQTAQTYAPQAFTVSGPSFEFSLSATTVRSGSTVHLASIDPCAGAEVNGSIMSTKGAVDFTAHPAFDGSWSVDVQTAMHDEWSGTTTDLRAGEYEVQAYCNEIPDMGFISYSDQALTIKGVNYVALGDSYSSGEGVEPFESGTAEPGADECHRSTHAYSRSLTGFASLSALNMGSSGFAACSGATTEAITTPVANNEPAQIDRITEDTKLVTMSIGGNDMDFANFAYQCIVTDCSGVAKPNAIAKIANNVIPNVRAMLASMQSHLDDIGNNGAQILVVGYPQVLPQTVGGLNIDCLWLNGQQEANAIRDVTTHLNTAIKNEVDDAGSNFHFVSATEANSPFAGHELCTPYSGTDPSYFIYPVITPAEKQRYSFHPNASGQWAYATLLEDYLYHHPINLN